MSTAEKIEDPGRRLVLKKLGSLSERLQIECGELETKINDRRISLETRNLLREKLAELKGSRAEIEKLLQRLTRL